MCVYVGLGAHTQTYTQTYTYTHMDLYLECALQVAALCVCLCAGYKHLAPTLQTKQILKSQRQVFL